MKDVKKKTYGLDLKKFSNDLETMKHNEQIQEEHDLAIKMDLYNTPTFFINGFKLQGVLTIEKWQTIIEKLLPIYEK